METSRMWQSGDDYERYMGRWSRLVAAKFVSWLHVQPAASWLDVGCGAGALTSAILSRADPATVIGIDPSSGFLDQARAGIHDSRATFTDGDAQALPLGGGTFDAVVSGLVLNFVPDGKQAASEMVRVLRPHGLAAAYVWDYAGTMELFSLFWRAAGDVDSAAGEYDQARKFGAFAQPDVLAGLWEDAGLTDVEATAIDIELGFRDFDDFWTPFLGGQGGAPAYLATLAPEQVEAVRERLRQQVPSANDGSIQLAARAWAVKGRMLPDG
jgi:SAM-dependent methyltransferase